MKLAFDVIPLYPLKFTPIFKEKIWGGRKLHDVLGKPCGEIPLCGESWELSAVEDNVSVVEEGPLKGQRLDHLINEYRSALLGKRVYNEHKATFPLLIKFIDAQQDLSIQVHPNDEVAMERHEQMGKTEMWYVMQADDGASLITGFSEQIDKAGFLNHMKEGSLMDVLNREDVNAGDVFFIPAGRIHTIGKGILLAEIQQTSDVTYRIYDFDRTDAEGNKRELHIDEGVEALDFQVPDSYKTTYMNLKNLPNAVVRSPYFITNKLSINAPYTLEADRQTFRILIFTDGEAELHWKDGDVAASRGDVFLIPASLNELLIMPGHEADFLEVRL